MAETVRKQQESWKNETAGSHWIKRLDHRGELVRDEEILTGKTFHITPEERRINSERAADEGLDVFRNGTFSPVRLIEDSDEARELASNPNVMSETDMRAMLKSTLKAFGEKVAKVSNPTTLSRIMAVAYEEDVSIKRVEIVKARLEEVTASRITRVSTAGPVKGSEPTGFHPVSPR